jgi:arylamine N-acetyltransferase
LVLDNVFRYLRLEPQLPSVAFLDAVLDSWTRRIPWESASRIARRQQPGTPAEYARLPDAFFDSALSLGTGGTCFETNLALRALLQASGFHPTLAFCDMETTTVNPHCALVVSIKDRLYMADAGYPVAAALELDAERTTTVDTPVYRFYAEPVGDNRWLIRRFSGAFESVCFVLKADPIDEAAFHTRLLRDHEPDGLFLDNVIIHLAQGDAVLRYSEDKGLVRRTFGREDSVPLTPEEQANLPSALSRRFGLDEQVLRAALTRS